MRTLTCCGSGRPAGDDVRMGRLQTGRVLVAGLAAVVVSVAVLCCGVSGAWAGTWTIAGSINNSTGSTADSCPPDSPPADLGCVNFPNVVYDDESWSYNGQTGFGVPAYVPAGNSGSFLYWATLFDTGADMYAQAQAPDGSDYVISLQDDVGETSSDGQYAGCAEAIPQSPQVVCTPTWSGDESSVQAGFTFGPSPAAPAVSAGQYCSATLGGGGPTSVDCTTSSSRGNIGPLSFEGQTTIVFQTLTPSVPISVSPAGQQDQCTLQGSGDSCTFTAIYPTWSPDVVLSLAADEGAPVPVGVEVTAVGFGPVPYPVPPSELPSGSVVRQSLAAGAVLKPGQAALLGPYRLVMRRDGNLVEYLTRNRGHHRVFASGTSTAGSTMRARGDEGVVVRSRRGGRVWSSNRPQALAASEGNLVLPSRAHRRLWSTGVVTGPVTRHQRSGLARLRPGQGIPAGGHVTVGRHRLTMRSDGELVLSRHGRRRWSAGTRGHPGAYLLVRRRGDVVVRSLDHTVLWSSHTRRHPGARLILRGKDGRVLLVSRGGRRLWATPKPQQGRKAR